VPGSREEGGFTLLEMLIVMVIVGVLAGVVVYAIGGIGKASAVTACRADYKTVEIAEAAYEEQEGKPAGSVQDLVGLWLREAPVANGYVIAVDPNYGDVTVQSLNPAHSAQPGSTNCAYA
jgi:general secretion pathway protein G